MVRPSVTPWDQVARTAVDAAGPPGQTGLRVAGDLAAVIHGAEMQLGPGIVLATDRALDLPRTYALIAEALARRGWTASPPPTAGPTAWLTLTRDDGVRTTLAVVRQPGLHPAVVVNQIPVAALDDCLAAARRAVAARDSAENHARLQAILAARTQAAQQEHAAADAQAERRATDLRGQNGLPPYAQNRAPKDPVVPPAVAVDGLERDRQARAQALRAEAITLARNLAAADLVGLTVLTSPAHLEDQEHLDALVLALRSSSAATQRTADSITASTPSGAVAQPLPSRAQLALQQQHEQPTYQGAAGVRPR